MPTLSTDITERQLKVLLWGDSGTRKTETVLRYFPNVLVFDIEGNADHAVGMEEIPPFFIEQTKDVYKITQVMDNIRKYKFADSSPIRTISLDSVSILWSVRTDVGALKAEQRAARYHKPADDATMTPLDWGVAKRPLRRLHNKVSGLPVDFIFFIAREKDIFEETKGATQKTMIDSMKGLRYEVNISFHFEQDNGVWKCTVDKVQGALGKLFPIGSEYKKFPYQALLDYIKVPVTGKEVEYEEDIARDNLLREEEAGVSRTKQGLIQVGQAMGLTPVDISKALEDKGLKFSSDNWDEIVSTIKEYKPTSEQI
jgi:hypothetical protein